MPRIHVTQHAIEQFQRRIAPKWSAGRAHRTIFHALACGKPTEATYNARYYEIPQPPARVVAKLDGKTLVAVTVISPEERYEGDEETVDEVVAAYNRISSPGVRAPAESAAPVESFPTDAATLDDVNPVSSRRAIGGR